MANFKRRKPKYTVIATGPGGIKCSCCTQWLPRSSASPLARPVGDRRKLDAAAQEMKEGQDDGRDAR